MNYAFPIAASKTGVGEFWIGGSKRPAILQLLEGTLRSQRHRFCPLVLAIVRHSIPWRAGRGEPLTIDEITVLNALLLRLQFKIPELHDSAFHAGLAGGTPRPETVKNKREQARFDALARDLIEITRLEPSPRGIAFEKFLSDAFALFDLAPRGAFSLVGEQIDGSFHLEGATYLLEAKWPIITSRQFAELDVHNSTIPFEWIASGAKECSRERHRPTGCY